MEPRLTPACPTTLSFFNKAGPKSLGSLVSITYPAFCLRNICLLLFGSRCFRPSVFYGCVACQQLQSLNVPQSTNKMISGTTKHLDEIVGLINEIISRPYPVCLKVSFYFSCSRGMLDANDILGLVQQTRTKPTWNSQCMGHRQALSNISDSCAPHQEIAV